MNKLHRIGVVTTVSLAAVLTPMAVAHGVNIPDAAMGRDANGNAFRYTPDVLPADGTTVADQIITKGDSITWTHLDTRPGIVHSVTSGAPTDTSHAFDSELLSKDGTFTHSFNEVGTFPYFCKRQNDVTGAFVHHNAGMKGLVHVLHNFTYRGPSEQVAQPGSVIPVKFTLHGFEGLGVIRQAQSNDLDGGDGVPAQTPGHSALSYDADTDTYNYLWKTDTTWAGQTREFSFQFNGDSNEPVRTVTTVNFK